MCYLAGSTTSALSPAGQSVRPQNLATIRALLHAPAIVDAGDNVSPQGAAPIFASRHCGAPMVNIDILLRSQPIRATLVRR
jgi:hypothetical protein